MNVPNIVRSARLIMLDQDDYVFGFIRPLSANQRGGDVDISGGKIDANELPAEAARREFNEETGVAVDGPIDYHYGVSERDGNTWFTREYFVTDQRIDARDIKQLTEHIGMVCASQATIIELTNCIPHQRAIGCLATSVVA